MQQQQNTHSEYFNQHLPLLNISKLSFFGSVFLPHGSMTFCNSVSASENFIAGRSPFRVSKFIHFYLGIGVPYSYAHCKQFADLQGFTHLPCYRLPTGLRFGTDLTSSLGFGTFGRGLTNGHRSGIEITTKLIFGTDLTTRLGFGTDLTTEVGLWYIWYRFDQWT